MALYAGDAKLLEIVEDVVRVTQDNDIAVACAVGGTSSVMHYKLNVKDNVKVSLLAQLFVKQMCYTFKTLPLNEI